MNRRINIILVDPENPDNIGASARAMKNMGLGAFRLVRPPRNWKKRAKKMAMHGSDLLETAEVFKTLEAAISDMSLVVATSRRIGPKRGYFLPFDKALLTIKNISKKKNVAIVFGRESKGLDNESIKLCDWVTTIPTHEDCPSLNLAQAVLIVGFSLFKDFYGKPGTLYSKTDLMRVPKKDLNHVFGQFETALKALRYEYEGLDIVDRILHTFGGIFKRNGMTPSEAKMFKGFFRRISERAWPPAAGEKTIANP